METAARPMVLDVGNGVRLVGAFSPITGGGAKGLVLLIHGWEGNIDSTYLLETGRYLYKHQFEVFRLNLRDHGDTLHLNRTPFFATRLDEVFEAVRQVSRLTHGKPLFLVGFSLGGNFVLRITRKAGVTPIEHLRHSVAISPVLDPKDAAMAIDAHPLFRWYFLKKWRRSLLRKAVLFPDDYDLRDILKMDRIFEMTDVLVRRYGGFENADAYFKAYAFNGLAFESISIPTTVITSADDPIISVKDFRNAPANPLLEMVIHRHGGHNGFIDGFFSNWYVNELVTVFTDGYRDHDAFV